MACHSVDPNTFLITDELIEEWTNYTNNQLKYRPSIFHKYFMTSFLQVHEQKSRLFLIDNLLSQFNSLYHFPISDCDDLFIFLFNDLPSNSNYMSSNDIRVKIFQSMNYFMKSFYKYGFSFIYRPNSYQNSIFSQDLPFIIEYFLVFSDLLRLNSQNSFSEYVSILLEDRSINNILNYLYDLYVNGIEFRNVKSILNNLFNSPISPSLFQFIEVHNLFNGCGYVINENQKIVLRLSFILESLPLLLESKILQPQRESICAVIEEMKIVEFIHSYFNNYLQELIMNKAYSNSSFEMIDFHGCQIISDTLPETDCLYQTITSLFQLFEKFHVEDLILLFSDISIQLILFHRCLSSPIRSLIIKIFQLLLNDDEQFASNRMKMIEIGHSLLKRQFESVEQMKHSLQSFFVLLFHQSKNEFLICEPIDFFNTLPDDLDLHYKLLDVIYNSVKNLSYRRQIVYILHILQKYSPSINHFLVFIFRFVNLLNKSDISKIPEELIGTIHHLFFILFNELPEDISENDVIHFCSIYSDVLIDFPKLDQLAFDAIQSSNPWKIQSLSSIYLKDKQRYQSFSQKVFELVREFVNSGKEGVTIDHIILTSPLLITTKFPNVFQNLGHQWIDQLFELTDKHYDINMLQNDEFHIDLIDQTIMNIVYALLNSYGFEEIETTFRIFDRIFKQYGMCIEILNLLSKILGFLIPYITCETTMDRINECNAALAPIVIPLISNTNNSFKLTLENDINNPTIIFSLCPLIKEYFNFLPNVTSLINGSNSSPFNCFYSYKFHGESLADFEFSFRIKKSHKPLLVGSFIKICTKFVENIALYGINVVNHFHVIDQFYDDCLDYLIHYAISHGLFNENGLNLFLNMALGFASDTDVSFDKVEKCINCLIKCINVVTFEYENRNTSKHSFESFKSYLTCIYTSFFQINKRVPGIINEGVATSIFEDDEVKQSFFLSMMDCDENDLKSLIAELIVT